MTGITLRCAYCGRPIVNAASVYGLAGEPYHAECTRPPATSPTWSYGHGCMCPPGSEATCKGVSCPRQPITTTYR